MPGAQELAYALAALHPQTCPGTRVVRVLVDNPWHSDAMLARQARVSSTTVTAVRHQLELSGQIPYVPVSRREASPRPRRPSATRTAVLRGARTARQVADAAQLSYQAGWKALRTERNRPPIPRAAATAD